MDRLKRIMGDTNITKLCFFASSPTPLLRRSMFASFRFCFSLIILASIVAPCELFAQSNPFSKLENRGAIQARRTSPTLPTQRRDVLDRANSNGSRNRQVENEVVDSRPSGGVPAQLTNADVPGRSTVAGSSRLGGASKTDSQADVLRSNAQGTSVDATPVPKTNAVSDDKGEKHYLEQTDGKYTFFRLAQNKEDFESILVAPDSFIVVVPRKSLLVKDEDALEKKKKTSNNSPTDSALPWRVESQILDQVPSKEPSVEVDDYVAFVLTNLDDDERVLLGDAGDGKWNSTDLLSASLIAEGLTTAQKRAHYRSVYGRLLETLKPKVRRVNEPFQKSEIVYNFLHKTALTSKYDLNGSSVAKALDAGTFNCVSATVLFNCFAKASGLNVVALETKGHAKSRIKFEDSFLDVETTCSDWNRLPDRIRPYTRNNSSSDKNSVAEGGVPARLESPIIRGSVEDVAPTDRNSKNSTASLVYDTKKRNKAERFVQEGEVGSTSFEVDLDAPLGYSFTKIKRPMHEISDVELVATIYYNVGVDYCQAGDYERAIASYVKAIQLAPNNQTIIGNLKATLNNWAINLAAREKRYDAAIQITLFGLAIDPNFEEFKVNLPIFFSDWVEYLAKDNKWEEIKSVQEESKRILATVPE